jgi:hypothetical protein
VKNSQDNIWIKLQEFPKSNHQNQDRTRMDSIPVQNPDSRLDCISIATAWIWREREMNGTNIWYHDHQVQMQFIAESKRLDYKID